MLCTCMCRGPAAGAGVVHPGVHRLHGVTQLGVFGYGLLFATIVQSPWRLSMTCRASSQQEIVWLAAGDSGDDWFEAKSRGRTGLQISFRSLLVLPTLFWSSLEEIINVMWLAPLISTVCVCCYQKNKLLCRRSCACACMRRLHAALDMVGMEIWTNPDGIESGCCFYRYFNSNMRKNTGSNV